MYCIMYSFIHFKNKKTEKNRKKTEKNRKKTEKTQKICKIVYNVHIFSL